MTLDLRIIVTEVSYLPTLLLPPYLLKDSWYIFIVDGNYVFEI